MYDSLNDWNDAQVAKENMMDIEKTLKELVELGLTKGEKYGHGASSSFALGYLRQAVESAILRLPAKQQKLVLEDLKHAIAAGQRTE